MLFARGSREVPGVTLANVGPSRDSSRPIWAYLACNETTTVSVVVDDDSSGLPIIGDRACEDAFAYARSWPEHEMSLVQHTPRGGLPGSRGKSGLDLTYDWTTRRTKSGHVPFDPGRARIKSGAASSSSQRMRGQWLSGTDDGLRSYLRTRCKDEPEPCTPTASLLD